MQLFFFLIVGRPRRSTQSRSSAASEVDKRQGHFAKGWMLQKVSAALEFVRSAPDRRVLITQLTRVREAMEGATGTRIVADGASLPV